MPILRQVLVHTVIATTTVGGITCFCPPAVAHAASEVAPASVHASHAHAADAADAAVDPDGSAGEVPCSHDGVGDGCGSDCTVVAATSANSPAKAPCRTAAQPDQLAPSLLVLASWPMAPPAASASVPRTGSPLPPPDAPVRRFDRLLD
jgi:hypothetical protein